MARRGLFTDVVVAALVTALTSAPIAGLVAYWNHEEAITRIQNERLKQSDDAHMDVLRLLAEQRNAKCAEVLTYLEDEKLNPALPAAKAQLLIEDMRKTASACTVMVNSERSSSDHTLLPQVRRRGP